MFKYLFAVALLLPAPVFAQQVNEYDVCTRYRETYIPGYYDSYGNYIQGRVKTESYKVICGVSDNSYYEYRNTTRNRHVENRKRCDPTRTLLGATLGGGVAAGIAKKDAYPWAIPLGVFIGGAGFGC